MVSLLIGILIKPSKDCRYNATAHLQDSVNITYMHWEAKIYVTCFIVMCLGLNSQYL